MSLSEALPAPDAIEPIRCFRSWKVGSRTTYEGWPIIGWHSEHTRQERIPDGMLGSYAVNCLWPTDEPLQAECLKMYPAQLSQTCEVSPGSTCWCGIYGHRSLNHIETRYSGAAVLTGVVALWGEVEECERGWRASRARPIALAVPDNLPALVLAKAASDVYEIPLVPANQLPSFVDRGIYRGEYR